MTPERYRLVRETFLAAREVPRGERDTWLAARCGQDGDLRQSIDRLLDGDSRANTQLDRPLLGPSFAIPDPEELGRHGLVRGMPERIGSYRILSVLGVGGAGVVYRARQDSPPRDVALKVARSVAADARQLERFRLEAEALGRLQHPGIATIFDAGTYEDGTGPRPYLAMECIDGDTVLEHVRREAFSLAIRLRLLCSIAEAVEHAHRRGIVHRDLKPGNVLVDGEGRPKVVDFGIAGALGLDAPRASPAEPDTEFVGTLPYTSPERLIDPRRPLDARDDVYSLGVLAYEVLCDRLPFDLENAPPTVAVQRVLAGPARPLGALVSAARGDLEAVVHRAMAREPDQRYASAGEFALDLRNVLESRPVTARPASAWRNTWLLARRRRGLFAGAATAVLALTTGLIATSLALGEARTANQLAEERLSLALANASRAERVRGFVLRLVDELDPSRSDGSAPVEHAIASATRELDHGFEAHPDLEGELRYLLGGLLLLFGRYDEAAAQTQQAIAVCSAAHGNDAPQTFDARAQQVRLMLHRERIDEAVALAETLSADADRVLGAEDVRALDHRRLLATGLVAAESWERAVATLAPLLAAVRDGRIARPESVIAIRLERVDCMLAAGANAAAREEIDDLLGYAREHLGTEHPTTVDVALAAGLQALAANDLDESETLLREVHRLRRARLPAAHPSVLEVVHNLGTLAGSRDDYDTACALLTEAHVGRAEALGADNQRTLGSLLSLANAQSRSGRLEQAATSFADLLRLAEQATGQKPWFLPHAMACSGLNAVRRGNLAEAVAVLRESLERMRAAVGEDHPRTRTVREWLRAAEAARAKQAASPTGDR